MKKSELVLGNIIKGYKGENEFTITQINEEAVIRKHDMKRCRSLAWTMKCHP